MGFYRFAVSWLGRFAIGKFPGPSENLKRQLSKSNLGILAETYIGKAILLSAIGFIIGFLSVFILTFANNFPIIFIMPASFVGGFFLWLVTLTMLYSYPLHKISSKKSSIEGNIPFSINHMFAISASGVPPFVIFRLISRISEYGEIAKESGIVVRNVEAFGMDIISAIKNVADRTPSDEFKQFLYGFVANIETGGNLKTYLENSAKQALFEYKLKREKYLEALTTYADFYTAVLIAAPMFFVSVLSVMSLVGGSIFGLDIPTAMRVGIFIMIPLLNMAFLMFIHYTQPSLG